MLKKYRGTLIFASSAKDDALATILEKVNGEIEKLGGAVLTTDIKGRRTFARPMSKRDSGVYVVLEFNLDTNSIDKLLGRFKLNEDVFRVQIIVSPPEAPEAESADADVAEEQPVEA